MAYALTEATVASASLYAFSTFAPSDDDAILVTGNGNR
jgi:hypothetical protein